MKALSGTYDSLRAPNQPLSVFLSWGTEARLMEPSQLQASAYRNAGHAVIALHLGLGLQERSISIVPCDEAAHPGLLEREYFGAADKDPRHGLRQRVEARVMISLAGPAAQQRFGPSEKGTAHSEQDHSEALSLLSTISTSDEERNAYMTWLNVRVRDMLMVPRVWAQVEAVASAFLEHKRLTTREVRKITLRAVEV